MLERPHVKVRSKATAHVAGRRHRPLAPASAHRPTLRVAVPHIPGTAVVALNGESGEALRAFATLAGVPAECTLVGPPLCGPHGLGSPRRADGIFLEKQSLPEFLWDPLPDYQASGRARRSERSAIGRCVSVSALVWWPTTEWSTSARAN